MKPAWRGVVIDGVVWAWPTLLLEHNVAFATLPWLENYSARWRQWSPGEAPDFDPGASDEDKALVARFLSMAANV